MATTAKNSDHLIAAARTNTFHRRDTWKSPRRSSIAFKQNVSSRCRAYCVHVVENVEFSSCSYSASTAGLDMEFGVKSQASFAPSALWTSEAPFRKEPRTSRFSFGLPCTNTFFARGLHKHRLQPRSTSQRHRMAGTKGVSRTISSGANLQAEPDLYRQDLAAIHQRHDRLVLEHDELQNRFGEVRVTLEKHRSSVANQQHEQYVVMLVDGNHYIFDDALVAAQAGGGRRTARLMDMALRSSLRGKQLEHCKVAIRIYADIGKLSRALHHAGLANSDARALGPFVAAFNSAHELNEFVDAGDSAEDTPIKLRSSFAFSATDRRCRHIFLAGCHDPSNATLLNLKDIDTERVTLVHTFDFSPEFRVPGVRVEDFRGIFRPTALDQSAVSPERALQSAAQVKQILSHAEDMRLEINNGAVCFFYQKGACRFGEACRKLHIKTTDHALFPEATQPGQLSHLHAATALGKESAGQLLSPGARAGTTARVSTAAEAKAHLPKREDIPEGHIAINRNHQRLDAYASINSSDRTSLSKRIAQNKLCNEWHLNGFCPAGRTKCRYDHEPITAGERASLQLIAATRPCKHGSDCMDSTCIYGHICQNTRCVSRGGTIKCRLPVDAHYIDLVVERYIDVSDNDPPSGHDGTASRLRLEDTEEFESASEGERVASDMTSSQDDSPSPMHLLDTEVAESASEGGRHRSIVPSDTSDISISRQEPCHSDSDRVDKSTPLESGSSEQTEAQLDDILDSIEVIGATSEVDEPVGVKPRDPFASIVWPSTKVWS